MSKEIFAVESVEVPMPPAKFDLPRVRDLWARGFTDTAIARVLGWDRETVRKNRLALGLPPAVSQSEMIARQRRGPRSIDRARQESNARRRQDLAAAYGLPEDLPPAQVTVVLALAAGPATAQQLADRCGRAGLLGRRTHYHRFQAPAAQGGNHLLALRRRGLVALAKRNRGTGGGSGRGESLYLLTPHAMDLLTRKEIA